MQDKTGWKAHDAPLLKAAIAPASRLNTRGSELFSPSPDHAHPANEQVTSVTLPKIFREIGRRVAKSPKVPAVLKHHMDAIAELKPAVEAKDPAAVARLAEVYAALGKDAYEKFGDKAVPKDIAPHLTHALQEQHSCAAKANLDEPQIVLSAPRKRFAVGALVFGIPAVIACGIMAATVWRARPSQGPPVGRPLASHAAASNEDDALQSFFVSALAEAKQAHELAVSLAAASLDGRPAQDIIPQCSRASDEIERDIVPTLRKYVFATGQRPEIREALLNLAEVLRLVQTEFDVVRTMAQSNNSPSTRLAFSRTSGRYEALHNLALRAMFPDN